MSILAEFCVQVQYFIVSRWGMLRWTTFFLKVDTVYVDLYSFALILTAILICDRGVVAFYIRQLCPGLFFWSVIGHVLIRVLTEADEVCFLGEHLIGYCNC